MNVNHDKGTVTVTTNNSDGHKESNTGNCYLTSACVEAIELSNYEFAYNRYKNSILVFEESFAKSAIKSKATKKLIFEKNFIKLY